MATPGGLVDKQELIDAQLDTAHLGRVVNSKDASGAPINTSTNRTGGVNKTLDALEAEYQGEIDSLESRSDAAIADAEDKFDTQRDQFNDTFQAQFAYKRIGNISAYVGDSLPEADKLNSYQYPDDSGEWYGPVQSQSFPITIPADPSTNSGWALVNALTDESLKSKTDLSFSSISVVSGLTHPSSIKVKGFSLPFIGAGRWETTGLSGSENYTPSLNASGQIVIITSDGVEFKYAPENGIGDPSAVGLIPNDLTVDNERKWTTLIAPNDTEVYKWDLKNNTYRMSVWRVRKQKITSGPNSKIQVFYGGSNPVMGQINTGAKIRDVNLFCEESNLDLARCGFTGAKDFEWIGGSIVGFRDTVNPIDAWGAYFEDCSGKMIRVGFKDNSQSDIAMVGNCKNLEIEGCYNIDSGDSVHINLEPLTSTDLNQNITLSNMDLKKLSLLENGTGGTANQQITVNSCYIDNFVNDGASVSFVSTRFNNFSRESTPYFGSYSFLNSLGLGENLIKDPYVMNVGFGSVGATTNNNDWYYKAATGDIDSSNVITPLNQDGFRFIRFNSGGNTGTFDIESLDGIDLGAGGVLAIVITGRSISGSSGAYFKYKSAGVDVNTVLLRQSNEGAGYWQTQVLIIPDQGEINPKITLYLDANDVFDISRITAHRVFSRGTNAQKIIDSYHANLSGARYLEKGVLPTMATPSLDGFLPGDRVSVGANDYVYTGSQNFDLITKS